MLGFCNKCCLTVNVSRFSTCLFITLSQQHTRELDVPLPANLIASDCRQILISTVVAGMLGNCQ